MNYDKALNEIYAGYPEMPYISPERDLEDWIHGVQIGNQTKVPQRNMERTSEGLLAGDIILLWRISHGSFTNEMGFHKYFEYDYGINGPQALEDLIQEGYAYQASAVESIDLITAAALKSLLKEKGIKGYSSLNKTQTVQAILENFEPDELEDKFSLRLISLTEKGEKALENNQNVIDRHPKKKFFK